VLKRVGGVDISFFDDDDDDRAVAAVVVMEFPSLMVLYQNTEIVQLTEPYIPGFLAFREATPIIKMMNRLKVERPEMYPQMLCVDGNGLWHPRSCGLASHLGVVLDLPTMGVSKKILACDGVSKSCVLERSRGHLKHGGDFLEVVGESGRVLGAVVRSTSASTRPVVVSVGHRMTLNSCLHLMPKLCKYRVCEPVGHSILFVKNALLNVVCEKHTVECCL